MEAFLDGYFKISERGSTIPTEIRAGVSSFLTMSYVILVNPQMMSLTGLPSSSSVLSTCLSSSLASLLVGLIGNLPFGLAPGMGLTAYLVYGLVLADVMTLKMSMTACFISGIFMAIFAITGVSRIVMGIVPMSVKLAIVVGMGILVSMIGMVSVGLVVGNEKTLVGLGDLTNIDLIISLFGLVLIGSLVYHNVKGGILIGITILTTIFWFLDSSFPDKILEFPKLSTSVSDFVDLSYVLDPVHLKVMLPAIASFVFIGIFDVSGVMFGLSALGDLMSPDGTIPGSLWGFLAAAAGTILASLTGCTPIIVTVECAAGIKEGGRTGLTAVVVGVLFLVSIFLAPLLGSVPKGATAPVLMLVGSMMMSESKNINWDDMASAIPAFLTVVMMPLTYSITNGIVFGLISAFCFYFTTGKFFGDLRRWIRKTEEREAGGDEESQGLMPMKKSNSFVGENGTVVRRPSFLLSEGDLEKIDMQEREQRQNFGGGDKSSGGGYGSVVIS
ncbi:hypothetical protein TrST_g7884 [Triparma strigata]|uniref:Uncharacterized protein n=1 Tax=Triparma strigata TaxID=1606541 RepID=A0A9W7EHZ5_9STRA|nr:hypothetical protein TrST_g7884 [Triparma strigata]